MARDYANNVIHMQEQHPHQHAQHAEQNLIAKHAELTKQIRSFTLRARRLSTQRQHIFDALQQEYILQTSTGMLNFAQTFRHNHVAPVTLEIGCGMGETLWYLVENNPQQNFIGIEVHRPGIAKFLEKIRDAKPANHETNQQNCYQQNHHNYNNVRLYNEDAIVVLQQCIPDNSISKILMFFPDPWPKQRHHKRRLIQPKFATLICAKLTQSGTFHLVTDSQNYMEYSHKILTTTEGFKEKLSSSSNALQSTHPHQHSHSLPVITKFAQRAIDQGATIWELVMQKITNHLP